MHCKLSVTSADSFVLTGCSFTAQYHKDHPRPGAPLLESVKVVAEAWKALPEEEKAVCAVGVALGVSDVPPSTAL